MAHRFVLGVAVDTALAVCLTGCRGGADSGPRNAGSAHLSALNALARSSQRTDQVTATTSSGATRPACPPDLAARAAERTLC